jgi:hypothetical protein
MASSAAPTVDAGIANKKYVDDQIAAIPAQVGFGAWASKSNNTVYQAATDGFVVAMGDGSSDVAGYTNGSNPPTTLRCYFAPDTFIGGFTMPVRKNDYWKTVNASTVYWLPLGS